MHAYSYFRTHPGRLDQAMRLPDKLLHSIKVSVKVEALLKLGWTIHSQARCRL